MPEMQVLQAESGFALFVNGILNATQQDAQATARSLEQMLQQVYGQAVDVRLVYNPTFATGNEFWIPIKECVRYAQAVDGILLRVTAVPTYFFPFRALWQRKTCAATVGGVPSNMLLAL